MKIGIVSCSAEPTTGWGSITACYCEALIKKGIDFTLFLPRDQVKVPTALQCYVKAVLPSAPLRYTSRAFLRTLFEPLGRFEGFDILHALDGTPLDYLALRAARRFRKPLIVSTQGTYAVVPFLESIGSYFFKEMLSYADAVTCPSTFTKNVMLSFYSQDDLVDRVHVIHNGIDYERFAEGRRVRQAVQEPIELIGVGVIKPRKGFDVAIKAIANVRARYPNIIYKIVGPEFGGTSHTDYLKALVRDLSLEDNVRFLGPLEGDDLVAEFSRSYAYIHTPILSEWNFEGFGIVYVEANAAGIPAIGPVSGGVPDAIEPGVSGLWCREGDPESAARCILQLIEDKSLYDRLCAGAVHWAKEHSWDVIVGRFLELYSNIRAREHSGS